jgi:hypothetical protein
MSLHVGRGAAAEMQSRVRVQAEADRRKWRKVAAREAEIDKAMDDASAIVQSILDATLISAGYHTHQRQWRKQRDVTA